MAGTTGTISGPAPGKDVPPIIRLDLVRVHADGTVHLLTPAATNPLALDDKTPARALPLVSARVLRRVGSSASSRPGRPETMAASRGRSRSAPRGPNQTWQVKETTFFNAERCDGLIMNQHSPDWLKPAGGTAWHHAEAVWVSTRNGVARRVHRVIIQRDGRADSPRRPGSR